MNKKNKAVNRKHKKTENRLKSLLNLSLKKRKKKLTKQSIKSEPQDQAAIETKQNESTKEVVPDKKTPSKSSAKKKTPTKKKTPAKKKAPAKKKTAKKK